MAAAAPVIRRLDEHVFAIRRNGLFSFIPADILFGASPTLFLDDFWENLYKPIASLKGSVQNRLP